MADLEHRARRSLFSFALARWCAIRGGLRRIEKRFSAAIPIQGSDFAGRIDEKDLRSAWPGDNIASRLQSGRLQPVNFRGHILHNQLDPVPAASSGTLAIRHGTPGRTGRTAEQQSQVATSDVGERCAGLREPREPEVSGVEHDGGIDTVDHVPRVSIYRYPSARISGG